MTLSPRWQGTTQAERTAHMRALASKRMRKLSPTARAAIGRALGRASQAARRAKRAT